MFGVVALIIELALSFVILLAAGVGITALVFRYREQLWRVWTSAMTSSTRTHSAETDDVTAPWRAVNPLERLHRQLREHGCGEGEWYNLSLIAAVDLTQSNTTQGRTTNKGRSLHDVSGGVDESSNFYQRALGSVVRALARFDADHKIPLWGFGDKVSRNVGYINMADVPEVDCTGGPDALLQAYTARIPHVALWGPTSFAPVIEAAAAMATKERTMHVLVILCDGAVSEECVADTRAAILNASLNAPLSIVIVGLGDGPFDEMQFLDEGLASRHRDAFDNVHFVEFARVMREVPPGCRPDEWFAAQALAELPTHFQTCARRGYMGRAPTSVRRRR